MILKASAPKVEPATRPSDLAPAPSDLAPVPVVTIPSPNPNQNYIANLQSLLQQQQQPAKANTIIPPVTSATSAAGKGTSIPARGNTLRRGKYG